MRAWILSFGLGIFSGGFIPYLPSLAITCLFLLPLLISYRFKQLLLGASFCLGIFWLLCWAHFHHRTIIPIHLQQQDLWVQGLVNGLPQEAQGSTRFIFEVRILCEEVALQDCLPDKSLNPAVRLLLNDYSSNAYMPGQHWVLQVKLKRPHGFANPGGFDYERWLFQEKISATGYVKPEADNILLNQHFSSNGYSEINLLRYKVQQNLKTFPLAEPGFIAALMIGDRTHITDDQWALLTHTGTNHLMVISGLHIGLVACLIFNISMLMFRMIPGLAILIPVSRLAAISGLLAAFFYAALAGFSLPVQRALMMVCCLMSGHLLVRQVSPLNNLCLSLLLILILDPLAPQSTGFWLSFSAVTVLILFYYHALQENELTVFSKIKSLVRCQSYLFLGMLPVMLLFFAQISLLAPLINIIAIPYIGLVVVPLCLLYLFTVLAGFENYSIMLTLPDFLLSIYTDVLEQISRSMDYMLLEFPTLPYWWLAAISGFMLFQFLKPGLYTRIAGLIILGASSFYRPDRPPGGEFILDVLDVGQGLATVITTSRHLLIYDTGPGFSPRFNAGSGIIQPFLRQLNLGEPDMIIVSHGDIDHEGGLEALNRFYPAALLITGEQPKKSHLSATPCLAGQYWVWDEVHFEFIHPLNSGEAGNNASCVLKVTSGSFSALLPGDLEKAGELSLLKDARVKLPSDLLIAPHHGSLTSSIAPFIRAINPRYGVFTTGYLNRFNHPHPDIWSRYQRLEVKLFNTSESGSVRFRISQAGLTSPETFREKRPRLWHLR